ncbi:MAG TPA: entericidin A/B family lipoprotein [Nitrospiraceae bacterium]
MLRRFKMIVVTAGAVTLMFALAGCNTVQGFGKDLQKLGGKLENAADRS